VVRIPAYQSGWVDWFPTQLVQDWISRAAPNYGLIVKDVPTHVSNEYDFLSTEGTSASTAPELDVVWAPRAGVLDTYYQHIVHAVQVLRSAPDNVHELAVLVSRSKRIDA
jgi:hypothetical protein